MADDMAEFVIHHGGKMILSADGLEYVGGKATEKEVDRDLLSYIELNHIGVDDLRYNSVEKMWYTDPGTTLADGINPLRNDSDVLKMAEASRAGVVIIYMECTKITEGFGDNDFPTDSEDGQLSSDPEVEYSAVAAHHGVIHLIDDSDRTSDPEFYAAMENLGIMEKRRPRTIYDSDGNEEVLFGWQTTVNKQTDVAGGSCQQPVVPDVINDSGGSDADDESKDTDYIPPATSPQSSYRASSESEHEMDDKVDGEEVTPLDGQPIYDPRCDHSQLVLKENLRFSGGNQFKDAITNYSIATGTSVKWVRSNAFSKEAICEYDGCKWRVYASWWGRNEAFIIKAVGEPHSCPRRMRVRGANARWVARQYYNSFKMNPDLNTTALCAEIKATHGLEVTVRVCSNARNIARKMIQETLKESYAKLRSYVLELKKADPEGQFALEVDPVVGKDHVLFRRIYIGFSCLRKGFLVGCRRMIGLDGCFLKGEVKGMLLSAVGKDGNNQMFPIAWAVVESENKDSWNWFVTMLADHLGIEDGTRWSVISDQQKGLVDSLLTVLPCAEHRKCARHVSANWKIKHKSGASRKEFWRCVYASNEAEFNIHRNELKRLQDSGDDPHCHTDFMNYEPTTFCRAFLSRGPKSDSVESKVCETFNGCIVKWRGLRIINMLEGIRTYMMGRLVTKVKLLKNTKETTLCPRIAAKIEKGKKVIRHCTVTQSSQNVCECKIGEYGYVVDLARHSCTCGYWDLSGIPCVHAIATCSFLRKEVYYWAHEYYTLNYAKKAYDYGGIPALRGQQAWEEAAGSVIHPPPTRLLPGRPKRNRRKERQEMEVRPAKHGVGTVVGKKGIVMHYRTCSGRGHNTRNCPEKRLPSTGDHDAGPSDRRRMRGTSPEVESRPPKRTVNCGHYREEGHNSRRCYMLRGIQVCTLTLNLV
ncbi:hypothetical protein LINGRAHAP2_LOCUS2730 [Linum grandiflorum]